MAEPDGAAEGRTRDEVTRLLQRLVACDTSNPPGREAQAAAILEDYLHSTGVACERVAKDPERPNLIATLAGRGGGPSLAFLGHLDVVQARRQDWSVEPFAGVERDGAIWGRGTIDMKCQVAATAVALATLAREGFLPNGDLMLILMADEEVGEAGVGAPFLVEAKPDLCPDYLIGEGAGERFDTPRGPLYLLDHGVKQTGSATLTVRGRAGDASLADLGPNASFELARLLTRLRDYAPPQRIPPEVRPLLEFLAPDSDLNALVESARAANPALSLIIGALVTNVVNATVIEAPGPENVVREEATVTLQCVLLPGVTKQNLEHELREALGDGDYTLEVADPAGGLTSPTATPLHHAIEDFLAEHDPDAHLIPTLAYGYSDCHTLRDAYGTIAYGFIPFRHADPMINLTTKHGVDERVLIDDLVFQTQAAIHVARAIGSLAAVAQTAPDDERSSRRTAPNRTAERT
jgi:acetylornithine deacetylase/succinyl-diaminopimelate desuccinylase-like protein